jgi:hypothetical protein
MSDETVAVDLGEVVHVLRLARDGWPEDRGDWTTDGFASAVWNGFIAQDDAMGLPDAGRVFLGKVGRLYPEVR